jgi:hypothetical protein
MTAAPFCLPFIRALSGARLINRMNLDQRTHRSRVFIPNSENVGKPPLRARAISDT